MIGTRDYFLGFNAGISVLGPRPSSQEEEIWSSRVRFTSKFMEFGLVSEIWAATLKQPGLGWAGPQGGELTVCIEFGHETEFWPRDLVEDIKRQI